MTDTAAPTTPAAPEADGLKRTNGDYNRAALKRHAIKVSMTTRRGKFTRVSEQFLNDVEAAADAYIRKLRADLPNPIIQMVEPDPLEVFITAAGKKRLAEAFNLWLAHEVQRRADLTRIGCTL